MKNQVALQGLYCQTAESAPPDPTHQKQLLETLLVVSFGLPQVFQTVYV